MGCAINKQWTYRTAAWILTTSLSGIRANLNTLHMGPTHRAIVATHVAVPSHAHRPAFLLTFCIPELPAALPLPAGSSVIEDVIYAVANISRSDCHRHNGAAMGGAVTVTAK